MRIFENTEGENRRMRNRCDWKYLICEIKLPYLLSKFAYLKRETAMMVWTDSYCSLLLILSDVNWNSIRMDELYFILVLDFLFINYWPNQTFACIIRMSRPLMLIPWTTVRLGGDSRPEFFLLYIWYLPLCCKINFLFLQNKYESKEKHNPLRNVDSRHHHAAFGHYTASSS